MTPIKLSSHFLLSEFTASDTAKRAGIANTPTPQHLANLTKTAAGMEKVRAILGGFAIFVTSAYRNPAVNKLVGGVSNSDHALGWAVDFKCPKHGTPFEVAHTLSRAGLKFDQLIHERKPNGQWWVHISFNPRARGELLTYNGSRYVKGIVPVVFK